MKNNLKFIVAVFGITVATFGSIFKSHATKQKSSYACDTSVKHCGMHGDEIITGEFTGC